MSLLFCNNPQEMLNQMVEKSQPSKPVIWNCPGPRKTPTVPRYRSKAASAQKKAAATNGRIKAEPTISAAGLALISRDQAGLRRQGRNKTKFPRRQA